MQRMVTCISRSLIVLTSVLVSCTGDIGNLPDSQDTNMATGGAVTGEGSSTAGSSCQPGSSRRVRRLSAREYLNVVRDLLGADLAAEAAPMLPFEPRVAGFDNQDGALLVSAAFQESLADLAEKLSAKVDASALAPCADPNGSSACLATFTRGFARKAYGRSPTNDEVAHLLAVAATGSTYANSVQLIVEVILQSPQMVYASELGPDTAPSGSSVTLTQQEVASQLSLLLTGARPDEELLRAADDGRLTDPSAVTAQVTRILSTPRAQHQLHVFVNGWVDIGAVADAPKNAVSFPTFTPEIAAAMQEELDAFIDERVAGGRGTLRSLLLDTSTHVPSALSAIYGSELGVGPDGAPKLDAKHRRGVLSLPGLLTYHSADQHSGPIERGLLVRRQLLCEDVAPPPATVLQQVAQNPINSNDKARTTRQKYEQHKTQAFCASCHQQFDVIGFGMEEMDGIGRFRTTENGLPVDSSGQLNSTDVDGPFTGVAELSTKLAASQMITSCFVRQFFRFAASRPPQDTEQCLIDGYAKTFGEGGGHLGDLIAAYVSDPAFQMRKEDR
jgi:hypothetical protein